MNGFLHDLADPTGIKDQALVPLLQIPVVLSGDGLEIGAPERNEAIFHVGQGMDSVPSEHLGPGFTELSKTATYSLTCVFQPRRLGHGKSIKKDDYRSKAASARSSHGSGNSV